MNTTGASNLPPLPPDTAMKTTRIKAAAWTAGVTAVLVLATVDESPNWPEALILSVVVAMVSFVCHQILHHR